MLRAGSHFIYSWVCLSAAGSSPKNEARNEVVGFLLGCFFNAGEWHAKHGTALVIPQGKLKKRKRELCQLINPSVSAVSAAAEIQ